MTGPAIPEGLRPLAAADALRAEELAAVARLGIADLQSLWAADPEAVALWADVPLGRVQDAHGLAGLLSWSALPPQAAGDLVAAGIRSRASLALHDPGDLSARLGRQGKGWSPGQVAAWITAASRPPRRPDPPAQPITPS